MKKRHTFYFLALLSIGLFSIQSCNKDDDCTKQTWYQDSDGDGFGNLSNSQQSCTQPTGYVVDNTDCDDTNASINPGAIDICGDGIDNNCDGNVDENCVEICDDGIDNDLDGLTDCDDPDCNGNVACPE